MIRRLAAALSLFPLLVACADDPAVSESLDAATDPTADTAADDAGALLDADSHPDDNAVGPDDDAVDAAPAGTVTWHNSVRAITQQHCAGCHSPGATAPLALDTYEAARTWSASMLAAVEQGRMPPWLPADDCTPIAYARTMPEADIAALRAWVGAGTPEGDPVDFVERPVNRVPLPSTAPLELRPAEAYTANPRLPDDYRCLVLDHTFEGDTWLTATDIEPDARAVVHHVLLYKVEADAVDALLAADAAEPGPGYTCFGGPGVGSQTTLAGWVPGAQPMVYPARSGIHIEDGARIVMQIHYNTLGVPAGDPIPADRTTARLWTLPAGEVPNQAVLIVPVADSGILIEAGDPSSVHDTTLQLPVGGKLIGTAPHMHTLGSAIRVDLERGTDPDRCLVNIPEWDFNWQQFYRYTDEATVPLLPGDVIRLTCTYDNSPENQPVVNGEQIDPRDVRWGEGTLDEMCLNYLIVTRPYYESDGSLCGGFEPCVSDCGPDSGQCYLDCATLSGDLECLSCTFDAMAPCVQRYCGAQALPLLGCIGDCGNDYACILRDCVDELDPLWACMQPHITAGECDAELGACGIGFAEP